MADLPNETELLLAAHHFAVGDAAVERPRLERAVLLPVTGLLHEQLQTACRRALAARPGDMAMVRAGLGELIVAIGEDADDRRSRGERAAPQRSAPGVPAEAAPASTPRKVRDPSNGELFELGGGEGAA